MRSSTSSSDDALSSGPWGRVWLLALALSAIAIGGLETYWRSRGLQPMLIDDADLWALQRSRVYDDPCLVLVGNSRLQLGFATEVARQRLPGYTIVQLAINGEDCGPVLRDLAEDPMYRGLTLVSEVTGADRTNDTSIEYVRHHRTTWGVGRRAERALATLIQEHVVAVRPDLGMSLLLSVGRKRRPLPRGVEYLVTRPDRSRRADYTLQSREALEQHREKTIAKSHERGEREARLEAHRVADAWGRAIRQRGGEVVFLHMPVLVGGTDAATDAARRRRQERFAEFAAVATCPTLDCTDVASMSKYPTPDGSHFDYRDAVPFTHALIDELVARGFLDR